MEAVAYVLSYHMLAINKGGGGGFVKAKVAMFEFINNIVHNITRYASLPLTVGRRTREKLLGVHILGLRNGHRNSIVGLLGLLTVLFVSAYSTGLLPLLFRSNLFIHEVYIRRPNIYHLIKK